MISDFEHLRDKNEICVGDIVSVSGMFGEVWLSALYGSAVGPSPTLYKFSARVESINSDGSYNLSAFKRVLDRKIKLHSDDSKCQSYPCNEVNHRQVYRVWYKQTFAKVYPHCIKSNSRHWPYVWDGQDKFGFYKGI